MTTYKDKYKRIFDIIDYSFTQKHTSTIYQKENGKWKAHSLQDFQNTINKLSIFLLEKGVKKGDVISVVAGNCVEWNIVDVATSQVGAILAPLYPNDHISNYLFILNDSKAKFLFSDNLEILNNIKNKKQEVSALEDFFLLKDSPNQDLGFLTLNEICKNYSDEQFAKLKQVKATVETDDLCILTYTSGTTGLPKGVMLTHKNICTNIIGIYESGITTVFQKHENEVLRALSFLPLCHVFERTGFYFLIHNKMQIYYAESLEKIAENIKEVKPHYFHSVPRLIEKIYDAIIAKGTALTGLKKRLFFWALDLTKVYDADHLKHFFYRWQLKLARKLIFSKWQEALGGYVRCVPVGAAALSPKLDQIFMAAGIPLLAGYGLSETSPGISGNNLNKGCYLLGTVGKLFAIESLEVKIDPVEGYPEGEGEIIVRGNVVTKGYYNNEKATQEAIRNGWFHTGDIGVFVNPKNEIIVKDSDSSFTPEDQAFLKITGRKKEIFKTSGGKYIVPDKIEDKLKESIYIEQAIAIGENRKHPSALIVPNFEAISTYCKENNLLQGISKTEDIVRNDNIINLFQSQIEHCNQFLARFEQVKKIVVLPHVWSIETGELTPTMKIKRRTIKDKYKDIIDKLYQ